jgi:fermentation-respiration switch protein FrsA (DUF1100 family)
MILGLAAIIVGLFVAYGFYLYFFQEKVVFIPSRNMVMSPEDVNLAYEDVYIEVAPGEKINAWFIPTADSSVCPGRVRTVLFCHGNAGNISRRVYTAQFLTGLGVNVLLYDYRGYGLSDGSPSEDNVYADTRAVYDWLRQVKGVAPSELFLFGRSLGGAVAVELARHVECAGLIVESSFTSSAELGQRMFPIMPVKLLTRFKFDSISKIGRLDCPILIAHSPVDELIPYEMGRKLYETATSDKRFIDLVGSHNERLSLENDLYINGLRDFLGCSADRPPAPGVDNEESQAQID